jgi:CRISPR-associated protein Csx3
MIAMAAIELTVISHKTVAGTPYQHLHVRITAANGIIAPADLKELALPGNIIWSQGVVIEGKAPTWLYAYLVHACHIAAWVATFDPRLGEEIAHSGGGVVVATHSQQVTVGEVLAIALPPILYANTDSN